MPVATSLFRRASADLVKVHRDCQFADDSALIATSHAGAQRALTSFMQVAASFGLTVNLHKTKVLAAGYNIQLEDRLPLEVAGELIENVDEFRYLGSIVHTNGRSTTDAMTRIAGASRGFGALRQPVFLDGNLSLKTKRLVYEDLCLVATPVLLGVLGPTQAGCDCACILPFSLCALCDGHQSEKHLGYPHDQG